VKQKRHGHAFSSALTNAGSKEQLWKSVLSPKMHEFLTTDRAYGLTKGVEIPTEVTEYASVCEAHTIR